MAAKKSDDQDWIPNSIALPELHPDFTVSEKLFLIVALITRRELQDKLTSAWYKMVKVINDWERSGAAHGMAVEELEGEGVYKFIDGDDRKNFLKERPPHVLSLWHISWTYGILNNVRQQLKVASSLDGNNAPSVSSSYKRKDLSSNSSQRGSVLSQDIRCMTNSIDGLVRVAQQSIKTQVIDILYWQVLQSTMKDFDETILDIELKIVDADEHCVAINEKALSKKQRELQDEKTKLEEIRSAIKEKDEETMSSSQVLSSGPTMMKCRSHPSPSQHHIPLPLGTVKM